MDVRDVARGQSECDGTALSIGQGVDFAGRPTPRDADRFTMDHVLPALEKMLAGLRGKDSPYEHLLETIRSVLLSPCGAVLS